MSARALEHSSTKAPAFTGGGSAGGFITPTKGNSRALSPYKGSNGANGSPDSVVSTQATPPHQAAFAVGSDYGAADLEEATDEGRLLCYVRYA